MSVDSETVFDVVIVGGGVVGCAVARLLSHHELKVGVVEAGPDIGAGTSKANTAILHTGFDATPGSLESRLVARGYALLREYAPSVGISVEDVGALLVAWDDEQAGALPSLAAKANANGYEHTEIVDVDAVYYSEPHLGPGATGGMMVPGEHIIDPWSTPLAYAYEAIANGAVILVNREVAGCDVGDDITTISTTAGPQIRTRFVVNAAGLRGDDLHRSLGLDGFTIRPRRGELIVFDKLARPLLNRTVLPVPTSKTKGVLVAPTVFGNVMLGPTADDIDDKTATGSTRAGIDALLEKGRRILPALIDEEVTSVYAGLRAASEHSDYQISHHPDLRYVCLGGIRSTGLTASMALAEEALARLVDCGLTAPRKDTIRSIHMTPLGEASERPYQLGGQIVCHCERVTVGEVTAACAAPVPAVDFDGLRRRTRALAGRCQGFLLPGRTVQPDGVERSSVSLADRRVAIVGGGPSGLSAAIELRRLGVGDVTVYEREQQAGGAPRHTNHLGFGIRDLHRVMSGPRYARTLIERATRAGVELRRGAAVFSLDDLDADAVILATGVRERPRSARLVPGDRGAGVFTTGAVQQLAMAGRRVGSRAVIVGAEHVSFSAILTLAHVGCRSVAMVTPLPRHQSYGVLKLFAASVRRVPVLTGVDVAEIVGRRRVERVVLTDGRTIECDTVVFTGDWIPDHELARRSGLAMNQSTNGPVVDSTFRTSRENVFAIGNLVHKVAAADRCALDGKAVAAEVVRSIS